MTTRSPVVDLVAGLAQLVADVAHRGEDERELVRVVRAPPGEHPGLDQQHPFLPGLGSRERAVVVGQLVPQHPDSHVRR